MVRKERGREMKVAEREREREKFAFLNTASTNSSCLPIMKSDNLGQVTARGREKEQNQEREDK